MNNLLIPALFFLYGLLNMAFSTDVAIGQWICQKCQSRNDDRRTVCSYCLTPRPDDERCTCKNYPGDNLRCPVHGVMEKQQA